MAHIPVPVQFLNAHRNYINYRDQREQDLIRRVTELEILCRHLQTQIDQLNRGMHSLQTANLTSPPQPQVNSIPKGPPPKKAPAPPLPDDFPDPELVGPQRQDMADQGQDQRENRCRSAPPKCIAMSLNLEVPKVGTGCGHGSYPTKALQPPPPPMPLQPPQQNPAVKPPPGVPRVKPPPDFRPPVEPPPPALVKQQSYIV